MSGALAVNQGVLLCAPSWKGPGSSSVWSLPPFQAPPPKKKISPGNASFTTRGKDYPKLEPTFLLAASLHRSPSFIPRPLLIPAAATSPPPASIPHKASRASPTPRARTQWAAAMRSRLGKKSGRGLWLRPRPTARPQGDPEGDQETKPPPLRAPPHPLRNIPLCKGDGAQQLFTWRAPRLLLRLLLHRRACFWRGRRGGAAAGPGVSFSLPRALSAFGSRGWGWVGGARLADRSIRALPRGRRRSSFLRFQSRASRAGRGELRLGGGAGGLPRPESTRARTPTSKSIRIPLPTPGRRWGGNPPPLGKKTTPL